jgi:hypothetical protein
VGNGDDGAAGDGEFDEVDGAVALIVAGDLDPVGADE